MTDQATTTRNAIARCGVKGCTTTVRVLAYYDPARVSYAFGAPPRTRGYLLPDTIRSLARTGLPHTQVSESVMPGFAAALAASGLVCPEHDRVLMPTLMRGTVNPAKECDGRCRSARGASCDCSCGGEHHGAVWAR